MPDRQDLFAKARAVGEALAADPSVRAHYDAQRAVQADGSAQQLLRDYQEHAAKLHQLEAEQKPSEVADKKRLRELEQKMAGHETLKRYMRAQADYAALMAQVNRAMDAPLIALAQPATSPATKPTAPKASAPQPPKPDKSEQPA